MHPDSKEMKKLYKGKKGKYIEIRESPTHGYGAYATKAYLKTDSFEDRILMLYEGERLEKYTSNQIENSYIAEVYDENGDIHFIDASDIYSCYGRFVNHNDDQLLVNAQIKWSKEHGCAVIVATANINIGDEIFIFYHDSFWMYKKR